MSRVVADHRKRQLAVPGHVRDGLRIYQEGGHNLLNRALWRGNDWFVGLTGSEIHEFRRMNDALGFLTHNLVSPGVTVYRGSARVRGYEFDALEAGDVLPRMRGYTSSSMHRAQAGRFLDRSGSGLIYELDVPEGLPGGWIAKYGSPAWEPQQEFILARECRILVRGIRQQGDVSILTGEVLSWR